MMNLLEFEYTIIGGGCIGSSIYYELNQRGYRNILLIDSGRNTTSATKNSGGMIRVFHENKRHLQLALGHFTKLELLKKKGLFADFQKAPGHLYFFNTNRMNSFQDNFTYLSEMKYPFEIITAKEGKKQFPDFNWKDSDGALYEPLGYQMNASHFSEVLIKSVSNFQNYFYENQEVKRICNFKDHYRLFTEGSIIKTRKLILAGGAKLLPRLNDLGIRLPLESKSLAVYKKKRSAEKIFLSNYFDRETLEFGCLGSNEEIILSHLVPQKIKPVLPMNDFYKVEAQDCYAPQRIGMMGQIPGFENLYLATGWGGTAFKFSLEMANQLVNSIERGLSYESYI